MVIAHGQQTIWVSEASCLHFTICSRETMDKHDKDFGRHEGYSRRGFIQFIGVGAGVVGASLLSPPFRGTLRAVETERIFPASEMVKIALTINGSVHAVLVEPRWSLLYVLREILGITGSKMGCDRGECGACTVLIDDVPRYSCLTLAVEAENRAITTVEGLMNGEQLGPVQAAFVETDGFQCGYCTPGQIMAVEGLLRKVTSPSPAEIRLGCSGNLCRCGAYHNIFAAAKKAAQLKKTRI
jgi:xanthine dehydrogenase YagT iron-sulfur-binding subunit